MFIACVYNPIYHTLPYFICGQFFSAHNQISFEQMENGHQQKLCREKSEQYKVDCGLNTLCECEVLGATINKTSCSSKIVWKFLV